MKHKKQGKSRKPVKQDERPPVVVSSGSVVFDPTNGTFSADSTDGKEWRNKGLPNQGSPVRFEITVTDAMESNARFDGTKLELEVRQDADTETLKIDIHQGDLRLRAGKRLRQKNTGTLVLDDWTLDSLTVKGGSRPGNYKLDSSSEIRIEQKVV